MNPDDRFALRMALRMRRRDPARVRVRAYGVGTLDAREILREALAAGADEAVQLDTASAPGVRHDPRLLAESMVAALREHPAQLVMCGEMAADTGQGS
ncbi:MAG: hypothetical protein GWO02_02505, partial [Gammaproteobacteria bacterium]|nr:hypothetical protein [Gammaproteobacteria bacterium]